MAYSSIITALLAAAHATPEDVPLRMHLGLLLLQDGHHTEALEQFTAVLAREPANLEALKGAADAAVAAGDTSRADAYQRLYRALSGEPLPQPAAAKPAEAPAPASSTPEGYDWNELLRHRPDDLPKEPAAPERIAQRQEHAPNDDPDVEIEQSNFTLADVAGMEAVKQRLEMAFLAPMRNPEYMRMYGKSLRGGLLLYGPPGCGKTFIARALAGELGAKFITVGMADVLDMWLGESEKRLQRIFDVARRNAPAVLFFDEIDALGQKRSHLRHSAGRNIVNQLLAEMDSLGANNDGVFVLGATNHPWDVDTALRRPGRFDRLMLVLPPDEPARLATVAYHLRTRPAEGVDVRWVASRTAEYSGADLAHLCESAAELGMAEAIRTGRPRPMTTDHFKKAMKDVRPSTRPWFEMARNYAMFANDGGVYDELLEYLRANRI
jgi:SpoVK/Ycf46/Vps4 family AAA+-type ATPase